MEGNQEAGPKGETGLDNGQEDDQRCEAAQKDNLEAEETGETSPKAGTEDRILGRAGGRQLLSRNQGLLQQRLNRSLHEEHQTAASLLLDSNSCQAWINIRVNSDYLGHSPFLHIVVKETK